MAMTLNINIKTLQQLMWPSPTMGHVSFAYQPSNFDPLHGDTLLCPMMCSCQ